MTSTEILKIIKCERCWDNLKNNKETIAYWRGYNHALDRLEGVIALKLRNYDKK